MTTVDMMKRLLVNKYDMKDLGELETIIKWQVTRDKAARKMKIDQLAFIRDLIIKKKAHQMQCKCYSNKD